MASSKEYKEFILEQLSEMPNLTCRSMMGEFLLYSDSILFGGIYDNRLLVKIVPDNQQYNMAEEIPYPNGKPMYFVEDIDNRNKLTELILNTIKGITKKA